jgi:dCMP deaminase
MKEKYIKYFMDVAELTANLSNAVKLKVGTVIVKDDRIISCGYNSTPAGWDNSCEEEVDITNTEFRTLSGIEQSEYRFVSNMIEECWQKLKTHDHVIHSEANALSRLAKSTESGVDSILFSTVLPCINCAKSIYSSGIVLVYYKYEYKNTDGMEFLLKCGIPCIKI